MRSVVGLVWGIGAWSACLGGTVHAADAQAVRQAVANLQAEVPQAMVYEDGGRITRVAGGPLAVGASPEAAAEQFRTRHAGVFGVPADELVVGNFRSEGALTQPVMLDGATGEYKFTLVYYHQFRNGVPVFGSELRVLLRNTVDHPVVLAASSLRALGNFQPTLAMPRFDPAHALAMPAPGQTDFTGAPLPQGSADLINFTTPELVIWAGTDAVVADPQMAVTYIGDNAGNPDATRPERWRFVADPVTGRILHQENLIVFTDVSGTVAGMVTEGPKAEQCSAEVATPFSYATASITSGGSVFTALDGTFTIPNADVTDVTVNSPVAGRYFAVNNMPGAEETLSQLVTPPGPADFLHNAANTDELVRAQANGYANANEVRDFALRYNPAYPVIATQLNFPVNVNRSDVYCPGNAWYDGSSINFCRSSIPSYPNTAFASVSQHEYGHHLVGVGGSGQGAYGEGMGDVIAMLIADDPGLGYGFYYNQCDTPLRNADNAFQYPCSGEIHYCGQLLSGCVWSTRNELLATNPATYRDLIANLTVNSILLHSGTVITPQITIDFLTLDDNDGNIGNGTPHRTEICNGFGAHNMDCPPLLTGLSVTPTGIYEPSGPVGGPFSPLSVTYTVENLNATPLDYTVSATQPWVTLSSSGGTLAGQATALIVVSVNAIAAGLAAGTYTDAVAFTNTTDHVGDTSRAISLTVGGRSLQYEWNLDTNPGWNTRGQWAWGQPTGGGGQYGSPDPTSGYTGTNVYGYNLSGDYPNSMPERHLTSGAIDCSALTGVQLRFQRWLGVEQPIYDHAYVRVSNDGTTWTTVWQNAAQVSDTAWVPQTLDISAVADGHPTVYLRWTMGATDTAWQFCGWNLDDIQIWAFGSSLPAAPSNVTATNLGGGQARVDWVDNASNETGFQLQRQQRVGGVWTNTTALGPVGPDVETFTDAPGLGNFRYQVRATSGAGNSAWSAWANVKVR